MEPSELSELAMTAIEAKIVGDDTRVVEVLQDVLVGGNKRDALAFTVACISTISHAIRPGQTMYAGPMRISPTLEVSFIDIPLPGQMLFAQLVADWLAEDFLSVRNRWVEADDEAASGAVGAAIWSAAVLVKQRRAVLN